MSQQTLDINGILISPSGEKVPGKLINISEKGFVEIYCIDELQAGTRYQFMSNTPRIRTYVSITSINYVGDTYHIEAVPEDSVATLQAKIIEQKVRGLLR